VNAITAFMKPSNLIGKKDILIQDKQSMKVSAAESKDVLGSLFENMDRVNANELQDINSTAYA
jgi:hypothetical protein